jgi:hypothetical protein
VMLIGDRMSPFTENNRKRTKEQSTRWTLVDRWCPGSEGAWTGREWGPWW